MGLGAFAASELDKVFSGYQPRLIAREDFIMFIQSLKVKHFQQMQLPHDP
jgi:hypothetical protein